MTVLRREELPEGRWKNGLGVSWDIASEPPDAGVNHFGWRFAIARIDSDVPFSSYPGVDRIFTLIDGRGLHLAFEGRSGIDVPTLHHPHHFPGDVPTNCRLFDGPCRALNLFLRRGQWMADVSVIRESTEVAGASSILVFALAGRVRAGNGILMEGDTFVGSRTLQVQPASGAVAYVARLNR